MDQVEILRTFIQRVQAMDTRDHNGEDNFACDFMVRAGGGQVMWGWGRSRDPPWGYRAWS